MAERIPDAPAPDEDQLRRFCHCVGLMLNKPLMYGHAAVLHDSGLVAVDPDAPKATHPPDLVRALKAAKEYAYELRHPGRPAPTPHEVDKLVAMIPEQWRDGTVQAAQRLAAVSERPSAHG